jgi:hypothetical protein
VQPPVPKDMHSKDVERKAEWPEPVASPPCRRSSSRRSFEQRPSVTGGFSAPLASRLQECLGDELRRLQDTMHELLEATPPADADEYAKSVRSLARRLGWMRSDLSTLAPYATATTPTKGGGGAPGSTSPAVNKKSFSSLLQTAASAEDFVLSLRSELIAAERVVEERKRAERLAKAGGMRVHRVAHDGDCLFACAHKWLEEQAASTQQAPPSSSNATSENDADDPAPPPSSPSAAEAVAELCATPSDVRTLVIDLMRERTCGEASAAEGTLDRELAARIDAAVNEAMHGRSNDGTSVALRAAISARVAQAGGAAAAAASVTGDAIRRESYLEVMGRTGIYGERLEIEAISSLVGAPVHVYYCDGASGDDAGRDMKTPKPNEVVVPGGVDLDAAPLRLLHLVNERHFELLLPVVNKL